MNYINFQNSLAYFIGHLYEEMLGLDSPVSMIGLIYKVVLV